MHVPMDGSLQYTAYLILTGEASGVLPRIVDAPGQQVTACLAVFEALV